LAVPGGTIPGEIGFALADVRTAKPRPPHGHSASLGTPDDQTGPFQTENLDQFGYLVEQVASAIVLASFKQYYRIQEPGFDLLQPASVS
jgi:hypothetical protein